MEAPLFHMGKRAKLVVVKGPSQKQAAHDAVSMAINKKKFLAALAAGMSPGCAAKECEISRTTAYNWKRDDEEFATLWVDAVETSLDRLETVMYQVALTPEGQKEREFQLRHRRPGTYHNMQENLLTADTQNNYFLNITLQEQLETLQRLGLPAPVIESDNEEDYIEEEK